jgi:hypothetical protein
MQSVTKIDGIAHLHHVASGSHPARSKFGPLYRSVPVVEFPYVQFVVALLTAGARIVLGSSD